MKKIFILFIVNLLYTTISGQNSLSELLDQYNEKSIPYISVEQLKKVKDSIVLLDARERKEYHVSHIPNAIYTGYDHFDIHKFTDAHRIPKNNTIVVYCSIGIRSEDIAEKIKTAGYKNVYNLYGGIFEWKNKHNLVVDHQEQPTDSVHAYSVKWSVWLHNGQKTYN